MNKSERSIFRLAVRIAFSGMCFLAAAPSRAGWTSGGGEFLKDAQNPWFIQNTTSVSYCFVFSKQNFHGSENQARDLVSQAISYWKRQFASAPIKHFGNFDAQKGEDTVRIATQSFVEKSCSSDTDIKFQFGFLEPEQKARLGDLKHFASLAVRTDYDPEKLKGRGFIYIGNGADAGSGVILYAVILHELGHVFGLSHTGNDLMAADWPEKAIASSHNPFFYELWKKFEPSYLQFQGTTIPFESCSDDTVARPDWNTPEFSVFTGSDEHAACRSESIRNFRFELREGTKGHLQLVGSADLIPNGSPQTEPAVRIYLTKQQRVFIPLIPIVEPIFMDAVDREVYASFTGTYRTTNMLLQRVMLYIARSGGSGVIGGILDGKLHTELKAAVK